MREFRKELTEKMDKLHIDAAFARRYLNDGFSGGEKKRAEILQMAMLEPKIAVLDETDSGLDIDALRVVAEGVNSLIGPTLGVLLITHYQRLLNYIKPDFVHVFYNGRIVLSGGPELALELEAKGYDWIRAAVRRRRCAGQEIVTYDAMQDSYVQRHAQSQRNPNQEQHMAATDTDRRRSRTSRAITNTAGASPRTTSSRRARGWTTTSSSRSAG